MTFLGPVLSLPVGFAVYTAAWVAALMILSEVTWRLMKHLPEDEEKPNLDGAHFEVQADDE